MPILKHVKKFPKTVHQVKYIFFLPCSFKFILFSCSNISAKYARPSYHQTLFNRLSFPCVSRDNLSYLKNFQHLFHNIALGKLALSKLKDVYFHFMLQFYVFTKVLEKKRIQTSSFYKVNAFDYCLQDFCKVHQGKFLMPVQNNKLYNDLETTSLALF